MIELFRCKKCGWICSAEKTGAIGKAHAHAEKHTSFWIFPARLFPSANPDKLNKTIELLEVEIK